MKYLERGLLTVFAIFILYACHQLTALLFARHGWKGMDASGWASWVQAIGSIAALAIAIYVMSRQNAHSTRLVVDADRIAWLRRARSVRAVLKRSEMQIRAIESHMNAPINMQQQLTAAQATFLSSKEILLGIQKLMQSIPAFDLGSYEMTEGVLQFTEIIDSYLMTASALLQNPGQAGTAPVRNAVKTFAAVRIEALEKFEKGMRELEISTPGDGP